MTTKMMKIIFFCAFTFPGNKKSILKMLDYEIFLLAAADYRRFLVEGIGLGYDKFKVGDLDSVD